MTYAVTAFENVLGAQIIALQIVGKERKGAIVELVVLRHGILEYNGKDK